MSLLGEHVLDAEQVGVKTTAKNQPSPARLTRVYNDGLYVFVICLGAKIVPE
jgi:hypothetical protein